MLLSRRISAVSLRGLRRLSTVRCAGPAVNPGPLVAAGPDLVSSVVSSVASVNPRMAALALTARHLAGAPLLRLPTAVGPSAIKCPTLETFAVKSFIVEDTRKVVSEPEKPTARVEEPRRPEQVRKHAIRMLVLRRKKMKKHQLKKLWQRMGGRFRADRVAREKKKELIFRAQLAAKVALARKFSAEQYVTDYLADFHEELVPKTHEGKKLPQWLIMELMEEEREEAKKAALAGRDVTTNKLLVQPGETVQQFIERTWK